MKHIFHTLFTFFCVLTMFTQSVRAEQILTYTVYAGGINAVDASINLDDNPSKYDLSFEAKTRGFLGKLAPWSGIFKSTGIADKEGVYVPNQHIVTSSWKDEVEVKNYSYEKGAFQKLTITEDGKDRSPKKIDEALTKNTTDLITASLNAMKSVHETGTCDSQADVFDGKRRFTMMFKFKDTETLTANRYNSYSGNAIRCIVEIEPITGKWHEKPRGWLSIQEQGRKKGSLPTVWFGQVNGSEVYVPVKVRVKTDYGTLFMHLKSIRNQS